MICAAAAFCLPACAGPLARIYIAPRDVGVRTGLTQQFSAIGEDADGNEVPTGPVSWTVNSAAGSVSSAGLFTAGSTAGKYSAAITASVSGGISATANVEVYSGQQQAGYGLERSIGSLSAGMYDSPMDIAFDGAGNVYVISQSANAINKFDSTGHFLAQFKLNFTIGSTGLLGVSSAGAMYVADPASCLIRKYDSSGTFVTQFGGPGTGNGQFVELSDMAVDSTGLVYVSDGSTCRVQVFDSSGAYLRSWTTHLYLYPSYTVPPAAIGVDLTDSLWVVVAGGQDFDGRTELWQYDSMGSGTRQGVMPQFLRLPYSFPTAISDSNNFYMLSGNTITRYARLPAGDYESSSEWGCFGREIGSFDGAAGIALDATGKLYVADKGNNRIQIFDSTGQFLGAWCSSGGEKGQFKYPSGILADSAGHLCVSDTGNHRVQEFDTNGAFIRELASKRQCDSAFACSGGLTMDAGGNIYTSDSIANRILGFNSSGSLVSNWPLPSSPDSTIPAPFGIVRNGPLNVFYAIDSSRNIVNTLDSSGAFVNSWLSAGAGNGQVQTPVGIAVESHGYAFVSDYGNNRIQKFNNGAFLTKWGTTGTGTSQFQGPAGICVDSADYVYVADSGNNRIQKFTSAGAYSAQLGSFGYGKFQFSDPEAVAVDGQGSLYVADTGNHRVLKFVKVPGVSVTITSPTSAATYSTSSPTITLGGTAVAPNGLSWSNNRGGSGQCVGTTSWTTAAGIPLKPGANSLTVTASDGYGTYSSDSIIVTCYAPSIAITSPTTAPSYITTYSTVRVQGTASDDATVASVTWINDRGGSGTCSGTTSWTAASISLQMGKNVLIFTAHDSGGNTNSCTLTVFRESDPPITISQAKALADGDDAYLTGQTVSAVFSDCLYIQQSDRASAIRVKLLLPTAAFSPGSVVTVAGVLSTTPDGERCIEGVAL